MDLVKCKKIINKAAKEVEKNNKKITYNTIENEMKKIMEEELKLYIAYAKLAINTLRSSATPLTAKTLIEEIDVMPKIYPEKEALFNAKLLKE